MLWYYAQNGQQLGPVDDAKLDELVIAGLIRDETQIWHQGMEAWQTHATIRGSRPAAFMPPLASTPYQYCAVCGRPFPANELVSIGSAFLCASCKPVYLQRLREGGQSLAAGAMRYAGFWIRFVAKLIDGVVLGMVGFVVQIPLSLVLAGSLPRVGADPAARLPAVMAVAGLGMVANMAISVAYEAYFLASRGATPGKMAVGLKVIRSDGSGISVGRAVGRYFATVVSSFTLLIGYIMAGFDVEKRALHDRICDTRVICVE